MIYIRYCFLITFYFTIINSSSILLNRLRKSKTITVQSKLSSPIEININKNSNFNLTCSFLSNFQIIDIFWLHNGTLIQSFISNKILEEEDDNSFLSVSIISTIQIEKIHFDINGFYQCIAVHQDIYAKQTFTVHINTNEINSIPIHFPTDAFITVYTSQALFEPRNYLSLMCRIGDYKKKECEIQWFNPHDDLLNILGENTDLVIRNATFEDNMGLYTCQICCHNQCQKLTSFIYPAAED
ncbi:unnamed protein product [Adineta steineri]|uniref:Ig-like domain-containing protein n=1 Tax=Adineta steineri TaxID=433720 RepID=A0A816CUJ2_9BILA|nr:unnamed protein product [Adineta steineri]CAF1627909.1 unnamed protein product [Adineta steineri]